MREGLIILPQQTNEGESLDALRTATVADLVDRFGGATVRNAVGSWRDDSGKLYQEPVWELVTAYEPTPDNDALLKAIAADVGRAANQLAVYLRYASGNVEILDTRH